MNPIKSLIVFWCIMMICIHAQNNKQKKGRKGSGKGRGEKKGINMDGNDGASEGNSEKKTKTGNPQRLAVEAWAASFVPEIDYNVTGWRYHFRSRSTTDYFYNYARKLSELFKTQGAELNFVMVGACDGVTDPLIKFHFLKQPHWKAVFVEPVSINVRDLRQFIEDNHASDRSHIIRAAATSVCETPTVDMERPLYEEKANAQNKTVPHWLRRQIGSILPKHRDHARPEWIVETVDCKTPPDILRDWAKAVPVVLPSGKQTKSLKRRPHILKIDVEGHDYQVLTGFVNAKTPTNELPLLICFEAKSIAEKFPALKEVLEQKGYVVSDYGQDGFAMLKADNIIPPKKRRGEDQAAEAAE